MQYEDHVLPNRDELYSHILVTVKQFLEYLYFKNSYLHKFIKANILICVIKFP